MYKLVIDLEMNGVTTEDIPKGEIIEIGAVLLDDEYNVIKEYDTYVKPDRLEIRNKVQRMTGITTDKLLFSIKIAEALKELISITPDIENTTLYTWSVSSSRSTNQIGSSATALDPVGTVFSKRPVISAEALSTSIPSVAKFSRSKSREGLIVAVWVKVERE